MNSSIARRTRAVPGAGKSEELDNAVRNSPGAGVARYELALLHDLQGCHMEALWLHALNRQQYPRFFRGRYRLGMSLEMIANPNFPLEEEDWGTFRESLRILGRCSVIGAMPKKASFPGEAAARAKERIADGRDDELRACRRQLALRSVIWETFRHRDERAVRKPYWRLRERQRFHDGVRVAELLVAVRQRLNEHERDHAKRGPPSGKQSAPSHQKGYAYNICLFG